MRFSTNGSPVLRAAAGALGQLPDYGGRFLKDGRKVWKCSLTLTPERLASLESALKGLPAELSRLGGGGRQGSVIVYDGSKRESVLPPHVLAWNDRTVERLAKRIYEERVFGLLPVLADALLDAGCEDEGLISKVRLYGERHRALQEWEASRPTGPYSLDGSPNQPALQRAEEHARRRPMVVDSPVGKILKGILGKW